MNHKCQKFKKAKVGVLTIFKPIFMSKYKLKPQ